MIVRRTFRFAHLFTFALPNLLRALAWSALVTAGYELLRWEWLAVPFLPMATVARL